MMANRYNTMANRFSMMANRYNTMANRFSGMANRFSMMANRFSGMAKTGGRLSLPRPRVAAEEVLLALPG